MQRIKRAKEKAQEQWWRLHAVNRLGFFIFPVTSGGTIEEFRTGLKCVFFKDLSGCTVQNERKEIRTMKETSQGLEQLSR